jgi:hypothetical protein
MMPTLSPKDPERPVLARDLIHTFRRPPRTSAASTTNHQVHHHFLLAKLLASHQTSAIYVKVTADTEDHQS